MHTQFSRVLLGLGGPSVGRICLSARGFGDEVSETEAIAMLERFWEAGENFIDISEASSNGTLEKIAAHAIGQRPHHWTIAAKATYPTAGNGTCGGHSKDWLTHAVDGQLERLGFAKINLLYLDLGDQTIRLEEAIEAVSALIESERIGGWGFANVPAWRIAELVHIADCLDCPRPIATQPYYHALHRLVEIDYLPACDHFDIGVVACAPLASGMLSGSCMIASQQPAASCTGQDSPSAEGRFRPVEMDAVRAIAEHLEPSGRQMSDFALNWVLANRLVSSVLVRPKTLAQLNSYLNARTTPYTTDDEDFINELIPSGNFAGSTYSAPRYASSGRIVR